ncbi:MAG TPA: RND transporter [Lachnospiraceae bacterium]|nr:RND transporter [Lachnospiraceae bacterium]
MRKTVTFFLILAILCGGFYFCLQKGYVDRFFPGMMEKVIPGYKSNDPAQAGRVSSDDANAVYVDSIEVIATLGSGTGQIPRFAGTVEPQETREYKIEGERKVEKCYVKEGDIVKAGQRLFTYDTADDEAKLEQARIDLERLQNTQDTSEAKRVELEKQKAAANTPEKQLAVLTAENELKQNELDQKSKQKEINALEEQIQNATVKCELDGVVKSVNDAVAAGDMGAEGAYISILKLGTYRIKASANEQNIKEIYSGEDVLIFSRVDNSTFWRGSITQIKTDQGNGENSENSYYGTDSSAGSTNYPFYVDLEDSDGLMLGQHVYLEQDLGQENAKSGLWLDDYYIAEENDGTHYVWAASTENKLEKRVVELGDADETLKQHKIVSGLTTDDYICQPNSSLEEGLPVHYNDASGEGETESIYNWEDDAAYLGAGAAAGLSMDDEEFMDESEWEFWDEYETEPDFMDVYGTDLDVEDQEEIHYETDAEGFYIMR